MSKLAINMVNLYLVFQLYSPLPKIFRPITTEVKGITVVQIDELMNLDLLQHAILFFDIITIVIKVISVVSFGVSID